MFETILCKQSDCSCPKHVYHECCMNAVPTVTHTNLSQLSRGLHKMLSWRSLWWNACAPGAGVFGTPTISCSFAAPCLLLTSTQNGSGQLIWLGGPMGSPRLAEGGASDVNTFEGIFWMLSRAIGNAAALQMWPGPLTAHPRHRTLSDFMFLRTGFPPQWYSEWFPLFDYEETKKDWQENTITFLSVTFYYLFKRMVMAHFCDVIDCAHLGTLQSRPLCLNESAKRRQKYNK